MTPDQKRAIYPQLMRLGLRAAQLLTSWWSDGDFAAFQAMSKRLRMDPFDLIGVNVSESQLRPDARYPADPSAWPIAVGLNQITRVAAAGAGLIPSERTPGDQSNMPAWEAFAKHVLQMKVGDQLPIVEAYFAASPRTKSGAPWPDAATIYGYNAASLAGDVRDSTMIYPAGSAGYASNRGLDVDGSGSITGKDLRLAIEYHWGTPLYQAAALRMAAPAIREGYRRGWEDAQARLPSSTSTYSDVDPGWYAAGYEDGYRVGSSVPRGATYAPPV